MRRPERQPSGAWKVRFRGPQKTKDGWGETSEMFATKREADQFCEWLRALGPIGAMDKVYAGEQQAALPTLDEVAGQHIAHLTGITNGTRKTYERLWSRTWGPHLGALPIDHVSDDAVARAINSLAGTYSRKSLENQRGLLSAVLTRAVGQGYLTKNPAKGKRLPRAKESERVEMRLITPEEFLQLEADVPAHYRAFVRFLAATGCRWGEAVALTVADVALPNVRIRRALSWSPDADREVGPTKTKRSNRTVALPEDVHDELRAACAGKGRGELVWTAPRGGAVLHRTFWSRVWLPAVSKLDPPRPRIHDLRHSHASWLLGNGVPIHVVQLRLGHESIKTTVDTYGHLLPDAQLRAAQAASVVFNSPAALEA